MLATFLQVASEDRHVLVAGWPISDVLSILSVLILVITIIVSVRALLEAARANALSSLPVLTLKYMLGGAALSSKDKVQLTNIGNGTALDVHIDKYYQSFIDDLFFPDKANHFLLDFGNIDVINQNESKMLDTTKSKVGVWIDEGVMLYKLFTSERPLIFHIRYRDLSGAWYISRICIIKDKVSVVGVPKRYNIWRKIKYASFFINEQIVLHISRYRANKMQKNTNKKRTVEA